MILLKPKNTLNSDFDDRLNNLNFNITDLQMMVVLLCSNGPDLKLLHGLPDIQRVKIQ